MGSRCHKYYMKWAFSYFKEIFIVYLAPGLPPMPALCRGDAGGRAAHVTIRPATPHSLRHIDRSTEPPWPPRLVSKSKHRPPPTWRLDLLFTHPRQALTVQLARAAEVMDIATPAVRVALTRL